MRVITKQTERQPLTIEFTGYEQDVLYAIGRRVSGDYTADPRQVVAELLSILRFAGASESSLRASGDICVGPR